MEQLETQRLKLLPFTLELKKVTLFERARLTEMLGAAIPDAWPGADMLETLPFFIQAMEQDPAGLVWDGILLQKADQRAIGGIGFHGPPDETGRVEIGYNIIPAYEGQGYATEMARRVIDWAFQTPGIQMITAECRDDNLSSIRVLEKSGCVASQRKAIRSSGNSRRNQRTACSIRWCISLGMLGPANIPLPKHSPC